MEEAYSFKKDSRSIDIGNGLELNRKIKTSSGFNISLHNEIFGFVIGRSIKDDKRRLPQKLNKKRNWRINDSHERLVLSTPAKALIAIEANINTDH